MSSISHIALIATAVVGIVGAWFLFFVADPAMRSYRFYLRRYAVVDALAQDPAHATAPYSVDECEAILGRRLTFGQAVLLARHTYGSRIFDIYSNRFVPERGGWSEGANGFPGHYVPLRKAAEILGMAGGRLDGVRQLLWDTDTDTDRLGETLYCTHDVLALAHEHTPTLTA